MGNYSNRLYGLPGAHSVDPLLAELHQPRGSSQECFPPSRGVMNIRVTPALALLRCQQPCGTTATSPWRSSRDSSPPPTSTVSSVSPVSTCSNSSPPPWNSQGG